MKVTLTHEEHNLVWPEKSFRRQEYGNAGSNPAMFPNEISECKETFLCINSEECSKNWWVYTTTLQYCSGMYCIDNQRVNRYN